MTIPSTARKAGPLLGTDAQTAWPFTFKVFAEADVAVTIADSLGAETTLVLDSDYSVAMNANQETSPGGTVTYPLSGDPLATGSVLSIVGDLDYDQPLDIPAGGNFSPLALENELDRLTMQIQQLKEQVGRAMQVPVTSSASGYLPMPEANALIGWDTTETALQNFPLEDLATSIAFATYRYDTFVGDGVETTFTLSSAPVTLGNIDVSIDGLTQVPGVDYTVTDVSLVFTVAPTNNAEVLARYGQGLSGVSADALDVSYIPAGTGAVATDVQTQLRNIQGWHVNVQDAPFYATGDGVTDDTAAIQAAIDAVYTAGGGTVFFPAGEYLSGSLTLKYKVSLEGSCPQQLMEAITVVVGSKLKLKASTNAPLITTDSVNGLVRGTSTIGVGSQLYQNSFIKNLQLDGNKSNQTSPDADLIRVFQNWNTTIQDNAFFNVRGFGIRALDCNTLNIFTNSFIGAPVYLEAIADSAVTGNQMGGGNGYVWSVLWFADVSQFTWQNLVQDNFIFNNSNNAAAESFTFTVDAGTDVATTSAAHGWVDGTPVIVETTSTIPAGLSLTSTYYVDVTGTTTVKFCATRAALASSTYVDITSTGAGTHTIKMGGNAGLYLSGTSVKWNKVAGNRFDQNYGHNILSSGARENLFSDNLINSAGLNNGTAQYGIALTNASLRNQIVDNNIDGTLLTSGAMNSNQTIGVYADSSSTDTIVSGNRIAANSTANVQIPTGYKESELGESIFVPMKMFTVVTGTPAIAIHGGGRRNVMAFDAAALEIADAFIQVPKGWERIGVTVVWANVGAGAGDVVWRVQGLARVAGETLNTADDTGGAGTTVTAGAQDVVVASAMTGDLTTVDENDYLSFRVARVGTDAADTLANDAGLIGVRLTRV